MIRLFIAINWTLCGFSFCMFTYLHQNIFFHAVYEHVRSELYEGGRPNDLAPEKIQIELDAHRKESQYLRPIFASGFVGWSLLALATGLNATMLMFLFKRLHSFENQIKKDANKRLSPYEDPVETKKR